MTGDSPEALRAEIGELMEQVMERMGTGTMVIPDVVQRGMNELLAEANVPYDELYEMDDINPEFAKTEVALVIGANDVTNPAARNVPDSPIYGMPILDVDKAASVIVLKRSMSSGFAGIDNPLFYDPKTSMLFGDAKASVSDILAEVHAL